MKYPSVRFAGNKPIYTSRTSVGADLCADIDVPIMLLPQQRVLVPTGTYVEIPVGYEGQVRPRSGLSFKYGIILVNSPGTIDSDYRGEIKIPLANISDKEYTIEPLHRIAQLVICPILQVDFCQVENANVLSVTDRGEKGFGSSGFDAIDKKQK